MRCFLTLILLLSLCLATGAQQASFTSFGTPCPANSSVLAYSGAPKIGTTFTINKIRYPSFCTRKLCLCNCCDCNNCGGAIVFFGAQRLTLPLPGGCNLLISPDVLSLGNMQGQVSVTLPNSAGLIGSNFYMQRVDVRLIEVAGTQCPTTYRLTGISGTSNAVHGVIGM